MKAAALTLALILLPGVAAADPITTGVWTHVASGADGDGQPFWDGLSWDGPALGIGYLLDAYGQADLEFLSDGSGGAAAFRFDDPVATPSLLYTITAWQGGILGQRADGAFTYDSRTGRVSNSWENAGQYALFRLVRAEATQYFLGVEDILLSEARNDRDYNDYVVTFPAPQQSLPEPSSLLLMLTAAGAGGALRAGGRLRARSRGHKVVLANRASTLAGNVIPGRRGRRRPCP